MTNRLFARAVFFTGAVLATSGCASGPPAPAIVVPEPVERIGPLDGTNYVMYYGNDTGLRQRNTLRATDTLLVASATIDELRVSPEGSAAAVVYRVGEVVSLGVVRGNRTGMLEVHRGTPSGSWTLAWSSDGKLGVGYQGGPGESSSMLGVSADNEIWDIGCSASDRFYAWNGSGNAVVGDARNVYAVNARGCATISTLPGQGKTDFNFSRDGRRLSFVAAGREPGLYIAGVDGSGATRVADGAFNPRNAQWAPDAARVAFEIRSRQYANVTHVAVYDVGSGQVRFTDRETELGMPVDANPCWSPDGRSLIHERSYYRSGATSTYTTRQIVVKTVAPDAERILSEDLISVGRDVAVGCWWVGGGHVVIRGPDSYKLTDLATSTAFDVPATMELLLIRPVSP